MIEHDFLFEKLSHVEFIPKTMHVGVQLACKPGDPIIKLGFLGKIKDTGKKWDQNMYKYLCDHDLMTKEEIMRIYGFQENRFDREGYIWDRAQVVIHFLDGKTHTMRFDSDEEAIEYFNKYKVFCSNKLL